MTWYISLLYQTMFLNQEERSLFKWSKRPHSLNQEERGLFSLSKRLRSFSTKKNVVYFLSYQTKIDHKSNNKKLLYINDIFLKTMVYFLGTFRPWCSLNQEEHYLFSWSKKPRHRPRAICGFVSWSKKPRDILDHELFMVYFLYSQNASIQTY